MKYVFVSLARKAAEPAVHFLLRERVMRSQAQILIWVVQVVASLSLPLSAANIYSVTSLGELPGGNDFSTALNINAYGQVVGRSAASSGFRSYNQKSWMAGD